MNMQFRSQADQASVAGVKTAIADCDIHPARATKTELYPFMAKRWHAHLETYDKHPYQGMMEGPPFPKAQPNASRRDAYPPERRPAGFVAVVHATAASRPQQRRARHPQSARHRAGHPQPGFRRGDLLGDQRLADRQMDRQGQPPESLGGCLQRGWSGRRGRNPQARRRQEFRPGAAAQPQRRAARPAPLLADL